MKRFFTSSDPVVPVNHPRVLVETAVALGADRAELFEGTGMGPQTLENAEAKISYDQFAALERNAMRLTGDPELGLKWGLATRMTHSGLAGIAAITSENLEVAFRVAKQYYLQLIPGWDIDLRVEGKRGYLTLRETVPRGDLLAFATEAVLSGFYVMVKEALGRSFSVTRVTLPYSRPPHAASYRTLLADVPFEFDQPVTEVEFDASLLGERIVTADVVTATMAAKACEDEASRGVQDGGLAAQVRRVLLDQGGRRRTLEEVARALQTSARSLRRALSQMGTSYQAIADDVLRERAEQRIRGGQVKIESLAVELGFTDARSFRRAFKRWTGQNPNEFRRGPDQR
ncbi:MAG TPA: AraC family transcriptional regulator [Polyangiaceae bacterium]|nr:AraC family transcriptional regulator [Polyangiaceae bacterium]